MKKIILLVLCLFLFTGCEVTYNLDIDDKINEDVTVFGDNDDSEYNMYEVYSVRPVPLSRFSPIQSESDERLDDVDYYDVKDISNDDGFGLRFTGEFNKNDYTQSNLVSYGLGDFKFKENESIILDVSNEVKIFNQFKDLDKITVNIKSKYKVEENNADSVTKNVYTWVITRDNYMDKKIKISFVKDSSILKSIKSNDSSMIIFAISLGVILLIMFIIYLFFRKRFNKRNAL